MAMKQLAEPMEQTASIDTQYLLERIDAIMHELQELRRVVEPALQDSTVDRDEELVDLLWGSLGQGSWDELNSNIDISWYRFDAPLD